MAEYNEDAYKLARKAYIEYSCPFERALLSRCVACSRARRLNLAEREAIACSDPAVRVHCLTFHQGLHENAQFALKINPDAPWPFGKEIRAQCGGARGLAEALGAAADETTDIAATVVRGIEHFGACAELPYSAIMRAVVHYEPRKRRR
jgi:hypothetical protein